MTNRFIPRVIAVLAVTLVAMATVAMTSFAQPPEGAPPGRNRQGPPGGFRMPPGFHLMTAIDVNNDGKLSTKEIDNVLAALQKLDKNKDGKLSAEEIGWPPAGGFGGGRRRGGFPGFGGPGGPGGGPGGPGVERPQRPETDTPSTRPEPSRAGAPESPAK